MKRELIPINTDEGMNARCIKAGYYKMGCTNFLRNIWGGKSDGFLATGIIEVIYGDIETDKDR